MVLTIFVDIFLLISSNDADIFSIKADPHIYFKIHDL